MSRPVALRVGLLVVVLTMILFPFGWLELFWQPARTILHTLFPNTLMHAAGHFTLFCLLGLVGLWLVPGMQRSPWRYLALMLLVALAQELLQRIHKGWVLQPDDLRDLAVDLLGATTSWLVWRRWLDPRATPPAVPPRSDNAGLPPLL